MFQLWPRGAFQEAPAARGGKAGRLLCAERLGSSPGPQKVFHLPLSLSLGSSLSGSQLRCPSRRSWPWHGYCGNLKSTRPPERGHHHSAPPNGYCGPVLPGPPIVRGIRNPDLYAILLFCKQAIFIEHLPYARPCSST